MADGEATINLMEMRIYTAYKEFLNAVVVPDDHRDRNSNDSNDEGEGEEAEMPSSVREGGTGARRTGAGIGSSGGER